MDRSLHILSLPSRLLTDQSLLLSVSHRSMQFFDLFFVESPRVNSETIFRLNSLENAGKKHLVPADPEKNILLKFHFVLEPPQID